MPRTDECGLLDHVAITISLEIHPRKRKFLGKGRRRELAQQLHNNNMAQTLQPIKKAPVVVASSRAWEALTPPLAEWIIEAVSDMGFKRMTPVQASTIPEFMKNRDVVVEVCTLIFLSSPF